MNKHLAKPKYYITTAIDYANGKAHLGHALEKIGADVLARYHRMLGERVHFLMGMDEHGQKVAQAAAQNNWTPEDQVEEISRLFRRDWAYLNISYDQFIRTTDKRHKQGVIALLERIFEKSPDAFYVREYAGWYCVGCEAFKTDDEIQDGKCVLHPTRTLEWIEENNWFFRLSAYSNQLRELVAREDFLQPKSRRNEILALIDQGLEDVSASRARKGWGIPFPRKANDGQPQTTYVWFDALPNYLTALGFPRRDDGYDEWWPPDVHVIGKDITRFHALIWPAMLMAADLPLPKSIWAHGFVTIGGDRFSKSAGVTVELGDAYRKFGTDAFRYFMMREIPFDGDGAFSWERFEERYIADLANAWGNLASRTMAMVERYCAGFVPPGTPNELDSADAEDYAAYHAAMAANLPHKALEHVWATVGRANEYVDRQAPWVLAKDPARKAELHETLAALIRNLVRQAFAIRPFMPETCDELLKQLGAPPPIKFVFRENIDPTGWRVMKMAPLFPKPGDKPWKDPGSREAWDTEEDQK